MTKIVHKIKKTVLVTVFFLVGFNLLALLFTLLDPQFRDPKSLFAAAMVAALVVGKVMVVTEGVVARRMPRSWPFLRVVLTKSAIFTAVILLAMGVEEILHGVIADDLSWSESWHHLQEEASGSRFAARSIYLMALFVLYSFVFELDQYLGNRNVLEIALSKYRHPVRGEYVVMQLGLLAAIPENKAEARAELVQELFPQLEREIQHHGGELEYYAGRRAAVLWAATDGGRVQDCLDLFVALSRFLASQGDAFRSRLGVVPRLRAGVARGALHAMEVVGPTSRDIVRDGAALDQAQELEQANRNPTVLFADDLAADLRSAGVPARSVTVQASAGEVTALQVDADT